MQALLFVCRTYQMKEKRSPFVPQQYSCMLTKAIDSTSSNRSSSSSQFLFHLFPVIFLDQRKVGVINWRELQRDQKTCLTITNNYTNISRREINKRKQLVRASQKPLLRKYKRQVPKQNEKVRKNKGTNRAVKKCRRIVLKSYVFEGFLTGSRLYMDLMTNAVLDSS